MAECYIVYSEPTGTSACFCITCPYMYLTIPTSRAVVNDNVSQSSTPWTNQQKNWRHRSFRPNVLKLNSEDPAFTSIWTRFCCRWSPMRLSFRRWIKWMSR